jgi:hypothetical protein
MAAIIRQAESRRSRPTRSFESPRVNSLPPRSHRRARNHCHTTWVASHLHRRSVWPPEQTVPRHRPQPRSLWTGCSDRRKNSIGPDNHSRNPRTTQPSEQGQRRGGCPIGLLALDASMQRRSPRSARAIGKLRATGNHDEHSLYSPIVFAPREPPSDPIRLCVERSFHHEGNLTPFVRRIEGTPVPIRRNSSPADSAMEIRQRSANSHANQHHAVRPHRH